MSKKIGIITFHRAINYGAILQAFGLQKFLDNMGFEVQIVDYRSELFEIQHSVKIWDRSICRVISNIIELRKKNRKIKNFENFQRQYLNCTQPLYEEDELIKVIKNFDILVVGSDQVFNYRIIKNEKIFLLDYPIHTTRLSYAASIGVEEIPEKYKKLYQNTLLKFEKISIRERTSISKLENVLGINSIGCHVDPSLLLPTEVWNCLIDEEDINKDYIVIYTVQKASERLMNAAFNFAKKNNCKIVALNFYFSEKIKYLGKLDYIEEGPGGFLSAIKNAKCVFTNSFHGTAFSIVYNKDFVIDSRLPNEINNRAAELLEIFCLTKHDLEKEEDAEFHVSSEQWNIIKDKITDFQNDTKLYFAEYK